MRVLLLCRGPAARRAPVDVGVGIFCFLQSMRDGAHGDVHVVAQQRGHQIAIAVVACAARQQEKAITMKE